MAKPKNFDFSGWATVNDLKCADGRTIRKDAFKHCDGLTVPLLWNHQHNDPLNVLGHGQLECRPEGVYVYGSFNGTEAGIAAKEFVEHGDVAAISIYANHLQQRNGDVFHGDIREVSLVLAGANPEALIDSVIRHGEECEDEAIIYTAKPLELMHSDDEMSHSDEKKEENTMSEDPKKEEETKKAENEETIQDVFDTFTDKQKTVVYAMIGQALEEGNAAGGSDDDNEEDTTMKHNLFDNDDPKKETNVLSHSDVATIITDAKRFGSLKDAVLRHCDNDAALMHAVTDNDGNTVTYGIANIDYLFPDARNPENTPDFISRDMTWVNDFIGSAKHLPFSRVKSVHANITMDEARAKGYIKANEKANEVFSLLKRTTNPTTIYKKQQLDRDDIVDITDFDVVVWLKAEMRLMLDEEIARAALVSDGRVAGSDDKISEDCIRPIWKDSDTYVVRKPIVLSAGATDDDKARAFIRAAIKSRKDYKGSGNPNLYTTEDMLTDCLLLEDVNGRVIYETEEKLRTALRVKKIITVPVMENLTREGSGADAGYNFELLGIIVNPADYAFGADKGGAVNLFDDFDIDFNQQKYLIETRCSGALRKYHSAIVIEDKTAANAG